jgi:predicted permease
VGSARRFLLRLLNAVRPGRAEPDLAREIGAHLQLLVDDLRRRGMSADDARVAARRAVGNVERTKDSHRDERSVIWLDDARRDVGYAARALARSPGFSAVAILTLAIGIGAATAIFTVVNAVVLRPLPVRHPGELVEMVFKYPRDPWLNSYGWRDYERFRDASHSFAALMAIGRDRLQVAQPGSAPELVDSMYVTGNFFSGLGMQPALGRLLRPADDRIGSAAGVAVISWPYWKRHFNLDPAAIGSRLIVNNTPVTIVGVTPRGFFGVVFGMNPPLWMPVAAEPLVATPSRLTRGSLSVALLARLAPGVTREQAQAEIRVLDRGRIEGLAARDPQWNHVPIEVRPAGGGLSIIRGRFSGPLLLMMGGVTVLLLLTCLNVASLLLARASGRRREIKVRVSLGAGRLRIARQLLTESLFLSVLGGAAGVAVAAWGAHALAAFLASGRSPAGMPQPLDFAVHLDVRVLAFALGTTIAAGVLFGLAPAWYAFASTSASPLRATGAAAETKRWRRVGQGFVIAQVGFAVVLVALATVFVRHLTSVRTVGVGFDADSVLQVQLDWSHAGPDVRTRHALYSRLLERVRAMGGVRAATLAAMTPVSGAGGSRFIAVEGFTEPHDERRRVALNLVAPGYFATLRTRLLAGRDFAREDEHRSAVAIVNEATARYYFGDGNPVGRHFNFEGQAWPIEIVGVVADAKYQDLYETPPRTIYLDAGQDRGQTDFILVLRTAAPPMSVAPDVRRIVGDALPNVAVARIDTLAGQVNASMLPERLIATLAELFGIVAALLAGIGLYGLLAFTVTRRVQEIGIRVAVGATHRDVIRMVLASALALTLGGLVIGIPAAFAAKAYVSHVLAAIAAYQAETPVSHSVGAGLPLMLGAAGMIAVALAAAYVPARRALRVDPIVALRCE